MAATAPPQVETPKRRKSRTAQVSPDLKDQPAYAFRLVIVALFVVFGIFVVAVIEWDEPGDVALGVGSVSGVIAAMVGAFFGLRGATYAAVALGQTQTGAGASGGSAGGGGNTQPKPNGGKPEVSADEAKPAETGGAAPAVRGGV